MSFYRMEGLGLLVVVAFVILTLAIVSNTCSSWTEAFTNLPGYFMKPLEGFVNPKVVPGQIKLDTTKEPKGYTDTADLPSAPVYGLAEANSLPFQDPALVKADFATLNELLKDMDGFASFEMPGLDNRSDPAVKLPLTRFKGDYQRIKDEVRVIQANKGLQSQLTLDDIYTMAANLRFLQRTYRLYASSDMVPAPEGQLTKVGIEEGFADVPIPITKAELTDLKTKLTVEITRLQATGTTDPVLQARVNVFTKMQQSVTDILNRVNGGTLAESDIPIMKSDYQNFLPSLTNSSTPIGQLLTQSGNTSLGSLFNKVQAGDVSGEKLAAALFEKYADELVKGVSVTYTSPRQVELAKQIEESGKATKTRGEFDRTIQAFEDTELVGGRPRSQAATEIGSFDWKKRVEDITQNLRRANLDPNDFGALTSNSATGPDFSWRGHAKMMCSRLATHLDPGIPEQMGCPPVSWKGWRI